MKAYKYNKNNNEFINEIDCQIDPLESEKEKKDMYLLPANSTFIKPPEFKNNEICIFKNNKWDVMEDPRKKIFYSLNTGEEVNKNIGDDLTDVTDIKPEWYNFFENGEMKEMTKENKTKYLIEQKTKEIKQKCAETINAYYDDFLQRNMLARFSELLEKKTDGTITADELTEIQNLKDIWAWVKNIREQSNLMEDELTTLEDDDIKNYQIKFETGM